MYVCTHACVKERMCVCMCVRVCVMCMCMYVCVHMSVYECVGMHVKVRGQHQLSSSITFLLGFDTRSLNQFSQPSDQQSQ